MLSSPALLKPLAVISKKWVNTGVFPSGWKKGNIVRIHGDKQKLKDYRPASLLPICGKVLERLMFNEIFNFSIENDLISSNQSDFKPDYSCAIELVSMSHTRFLKILAKIMRLGVFSLTSEKHLIKFGTTV